MSDILGYKYVVKILHTFYLKDMILYFIEMIFEPFKYSYNFIKIFSKANNLFIK